jgi:hypothetical protein
MQEYYSGFMHTIRVSNEARSSNWLKLTNATLKDNLIVYEIDKTTNWLHTYEGGDLSPWAKRIKFEIDPAKIDGTLVDYPLLVNVTDSSGLNHQDLSDVFDELEFGSLNDDFTGNDGDTLNTSLWRDSLFRIQNNKAEITIQNAYNASYTKYLITSGFESTLDYTIDLSSDTNSWKIGFRLVLYPEDSSTYVLVTLLRNYYDGNKYTIHVYDGSWTIINSLNTTDTSGSLKITYNKTTAQFKFYYKLNGEWSFIDDYTFTAFTIAYIKNGFFVESYSDDPLLKVSVDNFLYIERPNIFWPNNYFPNIKKIAITTEDGTNQLPVEIENWDQTSKSAQLWTKVPAIKSDEATVLYLYYDSEKSDNNDFVGTTSSIPAQKVWDDNYEVVYHMAQNPSAGNDCILDSTINANHGSSSGTMTSNDLVNGLNGKAIEFDGSNDQIYCYLNKALPIITIESVHYASNPNDTNFAIFSNYGYVKNCVDDGDLQLFCTDATVQRARLMNLATPLDQPMAINTWYHHVATYDTTVFKCYIDGIQYDSINASCTSTATTYPFVFGADADSSGTGSGNWLEGKIAEVRISNITRAANWIKATNYTLRDSIVYYYATENYTPEGPTPSYYFHGWVKEQGAPSQKPLYLYRRDTGELMDKTTSDEAGFYQLESAYNIEHFIVVLDTDNKDPQYEPLISDKLLPNEKN